LGDDDNEDDDDKEDEEEDDDDDEKEKDGKGMGESDLDEAFEAISFCLINSSILNDSLFFSSSFLHFI
jgi:hypothetical protein